MFTVYYYHPIFAIVATLFLLATVAHAVVNPEPVTGDTAVHDPCEMILIELSPSC